MADKEMKVVFERPHALLPVVTNYCPGCSHGIVNRLVAECLDELDVEGSTVGIAPVGCTVTSYDFYGCDMIEAAHGRAPGVGTAGERARPHRGVGADHRAGDRGAPRQAAPRWGAPSGPTNSWDATCARRRPAVRRRWPPP